MLKKANRILKDKEFDRAFKIGHSFYGQALGLRAVDNGLEQTRLGVLISTKVSKKAVIRNRFKRQIRDIIRTELPGLKTGKDLVIIVFPQILDKNYEEIRLLIQKSLKKLGLYR